MILWLTYKWILCVSAHSLLFGPWITRAYESLLGRTRYLYSWIPLREHSWIKDTSLIRTLDQVPTSYKYVLFVPWNEDTSLIRTHFTGLRVSVRERFHWGIHVCMLKMGPDINWPVSGEGKHYVCLLNECLLCVCVCVCVRACACVCVRERETYATVYIHTHVLTTHATPI